jgi:hypothetical protein
MLLDHRFERLLRDRIGPDQYASLKPKSKEAARTYWQDRVKPNYVGKYDEDYGEIDYFIPLPGASDDPTVPIEDGFFHLSSDDVERIFDPIVCDVEELIAGQVASITRVGLSIEVIPNEPTSQRSGLMCTRPLFSWAVLGHRNIFFAACKSSIQP